MKTLSLFLCLFCLSSLSLAQNDFVFSASSGMNNSFSINNSERWYEADDIGQPLGQAYPTWINSSSPFNATIPSTDTVYIAESLSLFPNGRLTNDGVLIVKDGGSISITEVGDIVNNGTVIIEEGGSVDNGDGGDFILGAGSTLILNGSLSIIEGFGGNFTLQTGSTMTIGPNALFEILSL